MLVKRLAATTTCTVLLATACAGIGTRLETPKVSFVRMRAVEASLFEQRLEVRLRVQNPNDIDLPVKGLELTVDLAGERFAEGISAREFTVPARGEAEFDMRVTAHAVAAILKIAGADREAREEVEYRLRGRLTTRLGLLRSIPFEETGTLPLADLGSKKKKPKEQD